MKATKPAKDPSDRQLLVRAVGMALWAHNAASEEPKMSKEEKQANWQENRQAYIDLARGVVRRLDRQGFKFSKVETAVPAKPGRKA